MNLPSNILNSPNNFSLDSPSSPSNSFFSFHQKAAKQISNLNVIPSQSLQKNVFNWLKSLPIESLVKVCSIKAKWFIDVVHQMITLDKLNHNIKFVYIGDKSYSDQNDSPNAMMINNNYYTDFFELREPQNINIGKPTIRQQTLRKFLEEVKYLSINGKYNNVITLSYSLLSSFDDFKSLLKDISGKIFSSFVEIRKDKINEKNVYNFCLPQWVKEKEKEMMSISEIICSYMEINIMINYQYYLAYNTLFPFEHYNHIQDIFEKYSNLIAFSIKKKEEGVNIFKQINLQKIVDEIMRDEYIRELIKKRKDIDEWVYSNYGRTRSFMGKDKTIKEQINEGVNEFSEFYNRNLTKFVEKMGFVSDKSVFKPEDFLGKKMLDQISDFYSKENYLELIEEEDNDKTKTKKKNKKKKNKKKSNKVVDKESLLKKDTPTKETVQPSPYLDGELSEKPQESPVSTEKVTSPESNENIAKIFEEKNNVCQNNKIVRHGHHKEKKEKQKKPCFLYPVNPKNKEKQNDKNEKSEKKEQSPTIPAEEKQEKISILSSSVSTASSVSNASASTLSSSTTHNSQYDFPFCQVDYIALNFSKFSREILDLVTSIEKNKLKLMKYKEEKLNKIKEIISSNEIELNCYGSHVTGLSIENSDVDIMIKLPKKILIKSTMDNIVAKLISEKDSINLDQVNPIFTASVPVIKVQCSISEQLTDEEKQSFFENNYYKSKDEFFEIKFDLTFFDLEKANANHVLPSEKVIDFIKSNLAKYPEMKYVIYFFKKFLLYEKINSSYNGGLSSYSLFLLILAYFKVSKKIQTISTLILDIFVYYGNFNFNKYAIDVTLDNPFVFLQREMECYQIVLLDPFTKLNVAKSSFRIKNIQLCFGKVAQLILDKMYMNYTYHSEKKNCFLGELFCGYL